MTRSRVTTLTSLRPKSEVRVGGGVKLTAITSKITLDVPITTAASLGAEKQVVSDQDKELVKLGRGRTQEEGR